MKRTLFLVAVAGLVTAAGCHPWDEGLATALKRLTEARDGGDRGDASLADAGDGGDDAGSADGGGCEEPLCLVYELHSGTTFRTAVTLGPHAFMAAGASPNVREQQAFSIDGGFMVRPLPAGFRQPYGMAG